MATINKFRFHFGYTLLIFFSVCVFVSVEAEDICGAGAMNYDVSNLTSRIWTFEGNSSVCLSGDAAGCTFYIGVCQNLNLSSTCGNSSVCEVGNSNKTYYYGLADNKSDPFISYEMPPGFMASFGHGQKWNNSCQLTTKLYFECNLNAVWLSDFNSAKIPFPPAIAYNEKECSYNITFEYAGACLKILPPEIITELSGGTVLLIIFIVTLTVYFTFGSMINIAKGKHGKDVIPNSDFWMKLPVYVTDGIVFTCRCCKVTQSDYDNI